MVLKGTKPTRPALAPLFRHAHNMADLGLKQTSPYGVKKRMAIHSPPDFARRLKQGAYWSSILEDWGNGKDQGGVTFLCGSGRGLDTEQVSVPRSPPWATLKHTATSNTTRTNARAICPPGKLQTSTVIIHPLTERKRPKVVLVISPLSNP